MDKPLILTPHELRAALAGGLRQVRRPVTFKKFPGHTGLTAPNWAQPGETIWIDPSDPVGGGVVSRYSPFGAPGDVLWGRETWAICDWVRSDKCLRAYSVDAKLSDILDCFGRGVAYKVGMDVEFSGHWRSPVTMPRWASRIVLPVAAVRVERAQDMTREDAIAMGCPDEATAVLDGMSSRIEWAMCVWDKHYAAKGFAFDANPWQWVAEIGGAR